MPSRSEHRRNLVVVGLLAATLAFISTVQVRSQAEVVPSLEGQDDTSLAFLIDDLHCGDAKGRGQRRPLADQHGAAGASEAAERGDPAPVYRDPFGAPRPEQG